jgi:hypothetical protein
VRKKVKTYHDGFITVSESRHAKLLDADGIQVLCLTTLPRSQQLAPDVDGESLFPLAVVAAVACRHQVHGRGKCGMRKTHTETCSMHTSYDSVHAGIDCFEGFLVNCLEVCGQSETQQFGCSKADSGAIRPGSEAAAAQEISAAPRQRVRLQVAQAAARSALVPKLKRKHDSGFSAPRVIAVLAPAEHTGVLQSHEAPCVQQQQQQLQQHGQQPGPALQPPQHQHVQQCTTPNAADAKRKRRRSGLHCNFMHLTDHASWPYACMHGRHTFQKLEYPKFAHARCM